MNLRRMLCLLLALCMCLSLAACGKSGGEASDAPAKAEAEEHPEFVYTAEYKTLVEGTKNYLSVRGYTGDGFYVSSMEKTGENIPEGVTPRYEGEFDVGATVGTEGTLTIIRDLQMKEPYVGSVPLVSGEIGDDVTAYFAHSEQTPTACALGVLVDTDLSVKVAGGYLIQLLPGASDEVIDAVEAGIQRAGSVTTMLEQGMTPEDILGQVLGSLGVVFMETTEVSYKCYCDRDRVTAALISLGKKELTESAQEGKSFPVSCQFCDTIYEFTPEDVRELLASL